MHGNVWEWCRDGLRTYTHHTASDPLGSTAPSGRHAYRGGSWYFAARNERSGHRQDGAVNERYDSLGLRVVMDVD